VVVVVVVVGGGDGQAVGRRKFRFTLIAALSRSSLPHTQLRVVYIGSLKTLIF